MKPLLPGAKSGSKRLYADVPELQHRAVAQESNVPFIPFKARVVALIGCAMVAGVLYVAVKDHFTVKDHFDLRSFHDHFFAVPLANRFQVSSFGRDHPIY